MDPKDRKPELTLQEKERRWSLVRERMQKEGLDALLIYGNSLNTNEVACRYLTNFPIFGSSQNILLFPVEKEPILLISASMHLPMAKSISWLSSQNIHSAANLGSAVTEFIGLLGLENKQVGVDNPGSWPMRYYQILNEACPKMKMLDVSRWYAEIRASNSIEEINLIRESINIGELAQRTFLANLSSGLTEEEVVGKVDDVLRANGVESRVLLISSTPVLYPYWPGETVIKKPNPVAFSAEFNRIRGYASQVVRTYCWDEPKDEEKRVCDLWHTLRKIMIDKFTPGNELYELGARLVKTISDWGFECESLGHGVGLTYFNQPFMSDKYPISDKWTILPNQVIVIHPMIRPQGGGPLMTWEGDMFLAGEDRTEWMTSFLPNIPEIIPQ